MLRTRVKAGPIAGLVLSLVAATIFAAIQAGDLFVESWMPKFGEPTTTTLRIPYGPRVVRDLSTGRAQIYYASERILVPAGTVLDRRNEDHRAAQAYEQVRRPPAGTVLLGLFVIYFTLSMALTAYLRKFGQSRLRLLRAQIGVFITMGLLALVAKLFLMFTALPEFWIPIAVVPLWVSTGYDRRTAFVVTVVLSFVIASMMRFDLLLLSVMLAQGMAATLLYFDRKYTRHMVLAGALAGLSTAALFVAILVTIEGYFDTVFDLGLLDHSRLVACVGGGVFGGLFAALLRGPVQRLLGHVPRERLLDLTDLEQPLLKKMAKEAPGSWEHSRAMANLAEAAASAIGADALLTRVGAYYHDLGKTTQPKYFVENLSPDEKTPHDELEPDVSADAIMAHVVVGTKILRAGGVPEAVVEFAYTHHGTQVVEFFYNKCLEQGNPKGLSEDDFRYPGMKPQTKETAILMLVDSIEAASRTIDPPDREQFETMIQRIIFTKLKSGQLDDSGLAVEDLRVLVNRMTDTLVNMHHHRIKYQWQAKQAEEFGVPSDAVSRPSAPDIELRDSLLPKLASSLPPKTGPSIPAPGRLPEPSDSEERPTGPVRKALTSADAIEAQPTGSEPGDRGAPMSAGERAAPAPAEQDAIVPPPMPVGEEAPPVPAEQSAIVPPPPEVMAAERTAPDRPSAAATSGQPSAADRLSPEAKTPSPTPEAEEEPPPLPEVTGRPER